MLDYVWLNMNFLIQMATIDARCWTECKTLGKYESDYDGADGCKLRPDEGLDAISSLAPGSISSNLFVGGTNTGIFFEFWCMTCERLIIEIFVSREVVINIIHHCFQYMVSNIGFSLLDFRYIH